LVDELRAGGRMPHLATLLRAGIHGVLNSPLPPLTPVAWAALLSGKVSANNGIYEWVRPVADARSFRPVSAADFSAAPIWEPLNASGVRVGLVNVPLTYPPPALDGFVIGGFMTPDDASNLCHPTALQGELDARFAPYLAAVPAGVMEGKDADMLYAVGRRVQAHQATAAVESAARYPVDVLIVNLQLYDQVNHFEPDEERVAEALACSDADLGVLVRGFQPDTVLLLSDHGTRRVAGTFLLGRWLVDRGYQCWMDLAPARRGHLNHVLAEVSQRQFGWRGISEKLVRRAVLTLFERLPAASEGLIWRGLQHRIPIREPRLWLAPRLDAQHTTVWAGSMNGGLYVEPFVPDASAERRHATTERLARELSDVRDPHTGAPLFAVHDGRALYGPAAVGSPPDLLIDCTESSWNLSTALPPSPLVRDRYFVEPVAGRLGEHAHEGIFVFSGPGIRVDPVRGRAELLDVAATLLHLHDVAIPADYDSQPMVDVFEPELMRRRPVRTQPVVESREPRRAPGEAVVDSDDLERRLRRLGYIE
jgi:predicted AlkP superfamily phosphohydrolase/phosphomutase